MKFGIQAIFVALTALLLGTVTSQDAGAQVKPRDPVVEVSIISADAIVAPGDTVWIAMHQDIYPGWHTYWLNAGDAGAAPTVTWDLLDGFEIGALQFPPPDRIPYMDLMNFGYSNELVLPMQLSVPANAMPGDVVTLRGDATWLVCEEICIPEEGKVALRVTIGPATVRDDVRGPVVEAAVRALPVPAPFATKFASTETSLEVLVVSSEMAAAFESGTMLDAAFFPLQQGLIKNVAEQNFVVTPDGLRLSLPRDYVTGDVAVLSGLFVFTQDLGDGTVTNTFWFEGEKVGVLTAVEVPQGAGFAGVAKALVLAFLGGLVLNVMPCVFPVLFLKAFAFLKSGDKDAAAMRAEGLSYTAGVVLSFALLGAALLALRAGGAAIGWGFQLQNPAIVGALALLLFMVGLSLSGVFSIGGSIAGAGSGLAEKNGHMGSFFTGVLATIVATPCTAPFMGAAIGFSLTRSAGVAMGVFIALGLGMAAPFLALSFFPALGAKLPKPGAWMERAKQVLAFPMYGAAAWLVWVFSLQAGANDLFALLLGAVLVGFGLWMFEVTRMAKRPWPLIGKGAALFGLVVVAFFLVQIKTPEARPGARVHVGGNDGGLAYEPYSEAVAASLVSEGKPVFVNFTAAWCISCLANEKMVFRSKEVQKVFADKGITYLKADWTNRDPSITKALARFDRAGVPLYLWYSGEPGAQPEILPQILTVGIMLEALDG